MLEMYSFLSQIPEDTLIEKQQEVIKKFANPEIKNVIYFISDGDSVKVGKSKFPLNRIVELQVGNPRKLIMLAIFPCIKREADEWEKTFHEWFKDKRIRGEWFSLTDEDIEDSFQGVIKFCDYFYDNLGNSFHGDNGLVEDVNTRLKWACYKNPYKYY